jgi:hypothetical protein
VPAAVLGVVDPLDDEQLALRRRLRSLWDDEREIVLDPARLRARGRADGEGNVRVRAALRREVNLANTREWEEGGRAGAYGP